MRRALLAALALSAACGGQSISSAQGHDAATPRDASMDAPESPGVPDVGVPEIGVPAFDGPLGPFDAPPGCTAEDLFDRDSSDVVGSAIVACLAGDAAVTCTHTATTLTLSNLAEGVAPVAFEYGTAADGTHRVEGLGTLVATSGPTVVFRASGVPAAVSLDDALVDFLSPGGTPPPGCTWR